MIRDQHPRLTLDMVQRRIPPVIEMRIAIDRLTAQLAYPPVALVDR